jgi:hypothetical protein
MSSISLYLVPIIYITYILIGTLILRNLAKNYDLESSYKVAFTVIFLWITITFATGLIIESITGNLSFTETQVFNSILFYIHILIISSSTFLIIGPLIVKKFYETKLSESFFIIMRVSLYTGIIQLLIFPIYLI